MLLRVKEFLKTFNKDELFNEFLKHFENFEHKISKENFLKFFDNLMSTAPTNEDGSNVIVVLDDGVPYIFDIDELKQNFKEIDFLEQLNEDINALTRESIDMYLSKIQFFYKQCEWYQNSSIEQCELSITLNYLIDSSEISDAANILCFISFFGFNENERTERMHEINEILKQEQDQEYFTFEEVFGGDNRSEEEKENFLRNMLRFELDKYIKLKSIYAELNS